jgi:hypothetical protein
LACAMDAKARNATEPPNTVAQHLMHAALSGCQEVGNPCPQISGGTAALPLANRASPAHGGEHLLDAQQQGGAIDARQGQRARNGADLGAQDAEQ